MNVLIVSLLFLHCTIPLSFQIVAITSVHKKTKLVFQIAYINTGEVVYSWPSRLI